MIEKASIKQGPSYLKLLTYSIQLVVIGLLGWYLYQNSDAFVLLRNLRWQQIVGVILLDAGTYLVNSLINYSMIQRLDPKIGFLDCLMLQYVNSLLNKVLPTIGGGAAFRAYYLKKANNLSYTQFASTIASFYIIGFITTPLIGILCLTEIYVQFHIFNWVIFLVFLGILLPTLAIILFSPRIPDSNHRVLRTLKTAIESWNTIKKDPRLVLTYMGLSIILLFLTAGYSYVGYVGLGVKPSLVPMLYLSTLGIIITFLNFTPDGIGVKEGIYLYSKELVQIPQEVLVLGSLYLRGISIITTLLAAGISYWVLMRRLKKSSQKSLSSREESQIV